MWLDDAFSKNVNKTFVNDLQKYYDAGYFVKDFADPKTVGLINSWVNSKTKGKIAEIIDEIDEETMMLLLNAVYFRANWMQQVDSEGDIEEGYFTMSNGRKKPAQFFSGMFRERRFYNGQVGQNGMNIRMLAVPFGRRAASIYFFMPRDSEGSVDAMISEMAENGIGKYFDRVNNGYKDYTVFKLPRVRFEYDESIQDDFSEMELKKPFDWNYGFDGVVSDKLIISKILHNTYFSMDEKGVEASAVTEVYVECLGEGEEFEPTRFRFDRPFVFAVRDDRTGTLLFIGKVEEPEFD
jgi:serpin B